MIGEFAPGTTGQKKFDGRYRTQTSPSARIDANLADLAEQVAAALENSAAEPMRWWTTVGDKPQYAPDNRHLFFITHADEDYPRLEVLQFLDFTNRDARTWDKLLKALSAATQRQRGPHTT